MCNSQKQQQHFTWSKPGALKDFWGVIETSLQARNSAFPTPISPFKGSELMGFPKRQRSEKNHPLLIPGPQFKKSSPWKGKGREEKAPPLPEPHLNAGTSALHPFSWHLNIFLYNHYDSFLIALKFIHTCLSIQPPPFCQVFFIIIIIF